MNKYGFITTLFTKDLSIRMLLMSAALLFVTNLTLAQGIPQCELPQFGRINIDPDFEVNGSGQNVDTIEFWKAPDSSETLMFVTAKGNQLVEVWKYPFQNNEQPPLTNTTFNNSQVNGLAIDQDTDKLYVAIGDPSSTVSVFSIPDLTFQMNFNKQGVNYHSEPNLTLLNLNNGNKNIYVSADFIVYIHDAVTGSYISEFVPEEGLETMAADSFYQRIYIPDENNRTGIYVYNPDGTPYTGNGSNQFGQGVFDADAEGIIVYNCPINNSIDNGEGFIVVSDQRLDKTDFEFFDRQTWEHLGTLNLTGVSNTDGIASFPYPLPDYPLGVFAALDNDHAVAIVGWDKIFDKIFSTTDVKNEDGIPKKFELNQNFPNPFNPSTEIRFSIPAPLSSPFAEVGFVTLKVYDVLGNEIAMLVNEEKSAGNYKVNFDASALTSGIYFYTLKTGSFVQTKKMILLR